MGENTAVSNNNAFGDIYHIIWFLPGAKSVGEVRNYAPDLRRYRRIGISLGDDLLKKLKMRLLMTEWTTSGPKIRVSTAFTTIPRSLREAAVWHEVGHIHHSHHYSEELRSQTERGAFPVIATDHGTLQEMEEMADRFAVLHSSKEALKGFLEYLLRARPAPGRGGPDEVERRGIKARIASIRGY